MFAAMHAFLNSGLHFSLKYLIAALRQFLCIIEPCLYLQMLFVSMLPFTVLYVKLPLYIFGLLAVPALYCQAMGGLVQTCFFFLLFAVFVLGICLLGKILSTWRGV